MNLDYCRNLTARTHSSAYLEPLAGRRVGLAVWSREARPETPPPLLENVRIVHFSSQICNRLKKPQDNSCNTTVCSGGLSLPDQFLKRRDGAETRTRNSKILVRVIQPEFVGTQAWRGRSTVKDRPCFWSIDAPASNHRALSIFLPLSIRYSRA